MSEEVIDKVNFDLVGEDSDVGYILEVDLKYPDDLHNLHNHFPLAPEKLKVDSDMLSSYSSNIAKEFLI